MVAIKSFSVLCSIWLCSYILTAFKLVHCFVLFQWSKSRPLHHYSEKSWLLVAVRWRYCRGKPECMLFLFQEVDVYFLFTPLCESKRGSGRCELKTNCFETSGGFCSNKKTVQICSTRSVCVHLCACCARVFEQHEKTCDPQYHVARIDWFQPHVV